MEPVKLSLFLSLFLSLSLSFSLSLSLCLSSSLFLFSELSFFMSIKCTSNDSNELVTRSPVSYCGQLKRIYSKFRNILYVSPIFFPKDMTCSSEDDINSHVTISHVLYYAVVKCFVFGSR